MYGTRSDVSIGNFGMEANFGYYKIKTDVVFSLLRVWLVSLEKRKPKLEYFGYEFELIVWSNWTNGTDLSVTLSPTLFSVEPRVSMKTGKFMNSENSIPNDKKNNNNVFEGEKTQENTTYSLLQWQ